MTHNQYPQPQDNLEQANEAVLHDAEVIARTIEMIPAHSDMAEYLAKPDTKLEKGSDGYSHSVETGYSRYDGLKLGMAKALDDVSQGKVGRVKLLAGMVNGHIDTHKGSSIPNLRYAFEQVGHFNITGNSGFHSMLNKSGEVVGKLNLGAVEQETDEESVTSLVAGAAKIREGSAVVMFNGYNDQPDTKMYGLRDPQTGELLKNTFMLVKSGTFGDKDGTASNFSNMAFAEFVMLPDEKLQSVMEADEQVEQPATEAIDMQAELAGEPEVFDIDKVDWSPFQDPTFKVRRSDGSVDNGGWTLREIKEYNGVHEAIITSWDNKLGPIQKTIPLEKLVEWQKENEK
jgi:hypothetical protein